VLIAGLAALCGLLAYAVFSAVAHGSTIDAQVRALTAQNNRLQQQIDERRVQIGEATSTDWLEEQARKLGFVFPGETIYILTAPGAKVPSGGGINAVLPTYAPSPSPSASASPGAASSGSPSPSASPTPITFALPTPTAH
jgi:cell division protein FtsB